MFKSSSEKTTTHAIAVQKKATGTAFFRKAGEESFFGEKSPRAFFNPAIQTKLSVSSPDDPQEKEADAVADRVMRMAEPAGEKQKEKEEEKIQPKLIFLKQPALILITFEGMYAQ